MKIIKFYQKNCVPCNILLDVMNQLELECDEAIEITPENVDEIKEKYGVMSTPLLIKYDSEGNEIERLNSVGVSKVMKFFNGK